MKDFEEEIPEKLTGRLKKCLDFSGNLNNKKILNIGCSIGWFEKFATEQECSEVVGIDINDRALKKAKESVKNNRVRFLKEDILNLTSFKKNYFDMVTMFDVIEHLPTDKEKKTVIQVRKILKKNGKIVISTPYRNLFSNLLDPAWYFGHRHYSQKKIESLLKENGFEVDGIEIKGGFNELISMIIFYIFKWVFRKEMPLKNYFDKKRDYEYNKKIDKGFVTLLVRGIKK